MNLRAHHTLEETPATRPPVAPQPDALDDTLPLVLQRDFIQLLLQSPHRLYLYWTFARDPRATLREAFGELAAHYRLAVRLVKVESGEEFLLEASNQRAHWFDVYPRHIYRAEVGFHAEDRPFVRLLSSNTVGTPPDRASQLSDEEPEFRLGAGEFARLLGNAGYERYAHGLADDAGGGHSDGQGGGAAERQSAGARLAREATDEYPHR